MTGNTALWVMAIALVVETTVVLAFAILAIYMIIKLKKNQESLKRRFESSQLSENIDKISTSISAILSNIDDLTETANKSMKDIKNSTGNVSDLFNQLNHITKLLSRTADALSKIPNSINDAVAHSVGSLKSTVEKESSDVYIGVKAALNVLKNIIKRRKNV
ncbi:MAG: DUF948 domain-containing protein [Epsilonproteobacteria bacterium]|nr:DUF948 domain-containing protein [Campylobacterota bacterium]